MKYQLDDLNSSMMHGLLKNALFFTPIDENMRNATYSNSCHLCGLPVTLWSSCDQKHKKPLKC